MADIGDVSIPKLVLPTGYEADQQKLMQRMQIAQELRQKALEGGGPNQTSYLQPIASLVQALMAKKMDKANNAGYAGLTQAMMGTRQQAMQDFTKDVQAGMPADQLTLKWGQNPWVQPVLGQFEAGAKKLQENKTEVSPTDLIAQGLNGPMRVTMGLDKAGGVHSFAGGQLTTPNDLKNIGGIALDPALLKPGAVLPSDPSANTTRNPDGSVTYNLPAIYGMRTGRTGAGLPTPPSGGPQQADPVANGFINNGGLPGSAAAPAAPVAPIQSVPNGNPLTPVAPTAQPQAAAADPFDTAGSIMVQAKSARRIDPMGYQHLTSTLGKQSADSWLASNGISVGN